MAVRLTQIAVLNLRAAEARWLIDYTDAQIVVVLDDLNDRGLADEFARLGRTSNRQQSRPTASLPPSSRQAIEGSGRIGGKALAALAEAAMLRRVLHRIVPVGLCRKDVLEYLPVGSFVPDTTSWQDLFRDRFTPTASAKSLLGSLSASCPSR